MSYLSLQAVQKTFGQTIAVHRLNLAIQAGELVSLLGPSGCGKTTILRMIAGFERPSEGSIFLGDTDISLLPTNRRNMGMMFQSYSLFPHMTAAQNIAFGLRVRNVPQAQKFERVQEMLDLVGLSGMGQRFPHQLSGGQQQRVALARALAIAPKVLLLDEPLSALDAQVRLQLRNEIRRIQQQLSITTLFVTHDQEEALSISDRVVVMSQGQIDQLGSPEDIYLRPQTPFTASFIGAMNQIPGTWRQEGVWVTDSFEPSADRPQTGRLLQTQTAEWPEGSAVVVLVRPESMTVLAQDDAAVTPGLNLLSGLIAGRTFLGSVSRLSVLVGDYYLNADVPTSQQERFAPGQVVQLSFLPEQCRVLPVGDEPRPAGVLTQ